MPIVKILPRGTPSYAGLVDYLQKEGKGKDGGKPKVITHNFRGTTRDTWVQELIENEAWRQRTRSDQIYLYHEIISLNHLDAENVTLEMLEDLANRYMDLRGRDGMYLAAFHEDKQPHIHFAVSGVKFKTGMAHRLTKETLHELKVNIQEYQKDKWEKEMSHSLPNHGTGKGYEKDADYFLRKRNERANAKELLQKQVAKLYAEAKSQKEFLELLREVGLHHYERNGVPTGILHDDLKFRFSRLETPLDELPVDRSEEDKVLKEIQAIRQEREQKDELGRDDNDFSHYIHVDTSSLFE